MVGDESEQAVLEHRFSNSTERIVLQSTHWGVVTIVVVVVAVLDMQGHMSDASATALLGTVLGHAGTSAAQKLSSRSQAGGR